MRLRYSYLPLIVICLSILEGLAADSGADDTIIGRSQGVFIQPLGDPAMIRNGVGTSQFSWGEETNLRQGVNQLNFIASSFFAKLETPFSVGKIDYYNGDTRIGTNAESVSLVIKLSFEDGSTTDLPISLNLISTPNRGSHYDNADIVEIENPAGVVIKINNDHYQVRLSFGETTEQGFSKINRFHVFEGFAAQAELKAELHPYTGPPIEIKELADSNASRPYGSKTSEPKPLFSTDASLPEFPIETTPKASAAEAAPERISSIPKRYLDLMEANRTENTQEETSKTANAGLDNASLPSTLTDETSSNEPTSDSQSAANSDSPNPIQLNRTQTTSDNNRSLISEDIPKTNLPSGKLSDYTLPTDISSDSASSPIENASISQQEQASVETLASPSSDIASYTPEPTSTTSRGKLAGLDSPRQGQPSYLAPSGFSATRAVQFRFPSEVGLTYQVQQSTDDIIWENVGAPISGTGSVIETFHAIKDSRIMRYRVEVTQGR